jgi:hypothetical protein
MDKHMQRQNWAWPVIILVLMVLTRPVMAAGLGNLCLGAIADASAARDLPQNMMLAIAQTESGRRDPATGVFTPWPWTINVAGAGYFFDTKQQAIAAVRHWQSRGVRSIDVGCMQVNLHHHARAFANLDAAFDPRTNAAYAARHLRGLYNDSRSWIVAIGNYHSATPDFHYPYRQKVLSKLDRLNNAKPAAKIASAAPAPQAAPKPASASAPPANRPRAIAARPATATATTNLRYTNLTIFEADAARRQAVMRAWEARQAKQTRVASR